MICRRAYSNNVLGSDNVLGLASCRRFSFAVCFSRRIDDCSGFAGSSVGFNPFKYKPKKGLKPTEEEADGAWGLPIPPIIIGIGIGHPKRKRSFLRKA